MGDCGLRASEVLDVTPGDVSRRRDGRHYKLEFPWRSIEEALELVAEGAGHEIASKVADMLDDSELSVRYEVNVASGVGEE